MYLNRITFDAGFVPMPIPTDHRNFNRLASFFEEVLFHYLPRRVNTGGFGYLQINLSSSNFATNQVDASGQIIKVTIHDKPVDWNLFNGPELQEGFLYLVNILELAVEEINRSMEIDKTAFDHAIAACRTAKWPFRFEQVLKVSRPHPSRKVSVEIFREVELFAERIGYRLLDGKHTLIHTAVLNESATVYGAAYDFRKSFWKDDLLIILDRFGDRKYELDIGQYIH